MSIAEMRQITLYGPASAKPAALAGLQELGVVHLTPLLPAAPGPQRALPPAEADAMRDALDWIGNAPMQRRALSADPVFDLAAVTEAACENRDRHRALTDRRDKLVMRVAALEPWGDFELPDEAALGGQRLWFFEVPHRRRRILQRLTLPWAEVGRTPSTHFVVVISPQAPPAWMMPVPRTRTGSRSLAGVRAALEETEIALEDIEMERIALTRYRLLIARNLARAQDQAALSRAADEAVEKGGVFAVSGWVPADRAAALTGFSEARGLALTTRPPRADELPPTRLDNPLPAAAGEDLARFYQVPSPKDWDPSGVLAISFALFFAMVLSDAGYGGLVLLGAILAWPRLSSSPALRRLRVLGLGLGAASVLYGIAAGSYFGMAPAPGGPLAGAAVIDATDPGTMMTLSIAIGVFHVVLASGLSAWARWPDLRALAALGWAAVAVGGFVAWRGQAAAAPDILTLGGVVAAAGLLAVLVFRGAAPGTRLLSRIAQGALGVAKLPSLFGDVLSYLRLFALGLASASLATTFNGLAAQVAESVGGVGLLLAILVAVIGHGLNFALAVVAGVVHGLRLNFIEFFNWGMTEEGYAYRPFERKELKL